MESEWITMFRQVRQPNAPVAPFVKAAPNGRINCADGNGVGTAPDCPVLVPSP